MNGFTVTVVQHDELCQVTLRGELDSSTSPALHAELAQADGRVVMDCQDLTFVDSSGVAEFVLLANRVESLTLVKPSASLQRILETLGLTELFQIEGEATGTGSR